MSLQNFITCPSDCDTALNLPAIPTDQDCTDFTQEDSQVCDLIIIPDAASDPFDWTTPSAPTVNVGGVDNTVTDDSAAKRLVVEGGVDVPEKEVAEYAKLKDRVVGKTYTLNVTYKNLDDSSYEFMRKLQCGNTSFKFYYANLAGYGFGPQGGIDVLSIDVDLPLGSARGDKQVANIAITWKADGDPERWTSPYA